MFSKNMELGRKGEAAAADFLRKKGYQIICAGYRTPLGQIDIIAKDKGTVCFIEVKSRSSGRFGMPQEAVGRVKQEKISRAAAVFLKNNGLLQSRARFDVVSIYWADGKAQIGLIRDAFTCG